MSSLGISWYREINIFQGGLFKWRRNRKLREWIFFACAIYCAWSVGKRIPGSNPWVLLTMVAGITLSVLAAIKIDIGIAALIVLGSFSRLNVNIVQGLVGLNAANIIFIPVFLHWLKGLRERRWKIVDDCHSSKILLFLILLQIIAIVRMLMDSRSSLLAINIWLEHLLKPIQYIASYYLIASVIRDKTTAKKYVWVLLAAALIVGLLIFYEELQHGFVKALRINRFGGHKADYGPQYVAFGVLAFCLSYYFGKNSPKKKIMLLSLSFVFFIIVVLSFSRTTYIALVCCLCYLAFKLRRADLILVSTVFILSVAYLLPYSAYDQITYTVLSKLESKTSNEFLSGRVNNPWTWSWMAIRQDPVFGLGIGAVSLGAFGSRGQDVELTYAHNGYLMVLADLGMVGLIFYFAFFVRRWQVSSQLFKHTSDLFLKSLSLTILVIIVIFAVDNIGDDKDFFFNERPMAFIWILFAVQDAYARILAKQQAGEPGTILPSQKLPLKHVQQQVWAA